MNAANEPVPCAGAPLAYAGYPYVSTSIHYMYITSTLHVHYVYSVHYMYVQKYNTEVNSFLKFQN